MGERSVENATEGTDRPGREPASGESYVKLLGNLTGLVAILVALGLAEFGAWKPRTRPEVPTTHVAEKAETVTTAQPAAAAATAAPKKADRVVNADRPRPAPAPEIDRAAVAKAEAVLDAATTDRARAEARADEASRKLAAASTRAAADARAAKTLAFRVRDPSARIAAASSRGGFLRTESDQIKGEIATLARAPRPKAKTLSNKNPVARPADGQERHFELRKNRISPIDIDRLVELVKADARLRIRLSDGARVVDGHVGPVGPFSLQYTLIRSIPSGIEELLEKRGISYDLRGWEVVPEFEGRGETFEATRLPISEYARTLNRLNPARDSVTLWVYPDGFDLFRKVREDMHARGFLVAARPLPEAMPIRGSPAGSLSAGQ